MANFLEEVSESDKQILKSVAPLIIVVILFVFVGKFGFNQIKGLRSQITEAKKNQSLLSDKLKILRSISKVSVEGANLALIAFPKSNPSLQVMSQVKLLAGSNLVVVEDVKSSTAADSSGGLSYVNTSFKIIGPKEALLSFIKAVENIAPITFVDKMELTEDAGVAAANVGLKTYYASLPTTIPTVTQAVTDLSSSEKEMLTSLSKLNQPMLEMPTSATISGTNPNPFGQ